MSQQGEDKNQIRDLMEYILLISFVFLGSSYALVTEVRSAREMGNQPSSSMVLEASRASHRGVIFGLQTKRHIK